MASINILEIISVDDREAFMAVYLYLKGEIIGYSADNGMKYPAEKLKKYLEENKNFKDGFEEGQKNSWDKEWATIHHIVYNIIRNTKHHTGTALTDREFVTNTSTGYRGSYRNMAEIVKKDLLKFIEEIDLLKLMED